MQGQGRNRAGYLPLEYTVWVQLEEHGHEETPVEVVASYYHETGLLEVVGVFGDDGLECSSRVVSTYWVDIEDTGYHWAHQLAARETEA